MYYGKISYQDLAVMPVHFRRQIMKLLIEAKEDEKKQFDEIDKKR